MLVRVLATLLLVQLSAHAPRKAAEDGPKAWAAATRRGSAGWRSWCVAAVRESERLSFRLLSLLSDTLPLKYILKKFDEVVIVMTK